MKNNPRKVGNVEGEILETAAEIYFTAGIATAVKASGKATEETGKLGLKEAENILGKEAGKVAKVITKEGAEAAEEGTKVTAHGAKRIAGAAATRGEVLSMEEVNTTKLLGRVFSQADGAKVFLYEITPGRFNVVVEGNRGIITTMSNWSQNSIDRIAKNYGWIIK